MQRVRHNDSLQGFMNSFRQFEKKLDKLQADVDCHGNTLSELRMMVANLSVGAVSDDKHCKSVGLQCEARVRRPEAMQALPTKLKAKSYQGQKFGFPKLKVEEKSFRVPMVSVPATVGFQRRPKKLEPPRKTVRQQKTEKTTKLRKLRK